MGRDAETERKTGIESKRETKREMETEKEREKEILCVRETGGKTNSATERVR